MRMRPWSKLKKKVESFLLQDLKIQFQLEVYDVTDFGHNADIWQSANFRMLLKKERILEWPKPYLKDGNYIDLKIKEPYGDREIMYYNDVSYITSVMGNYLNLSKDDVLNLKLFDDKDDPFGFAYVLAAADKRIGRKTLLLLSVQDGLPYATRAAVNRIVKERLKLLGDVD